MPQEKLSGTIQNDILKEFMVRNTYIYPPGPSMRIVADIIEYTAQHMPKFNSISISGYHMQEAGATLRAGAGLHARRRPRICARRHGQGPRHRRLRAAAVVLLLHRHEFLHGGGEAARRAPPVGRADQAVRAEEGRLAGAAHPLPDLGRVAHRAGPLQQRHPHRLSRRWRRCWAARSRCTPIRFDEAIALPTPFSARIARNTQLILQEETGITKVVDPLAGSYYVESADREPGRRGAQADRRGRGAGRHDQGGRGRHAEAAHRGGRGAPPGAHRPRRGGRSSASTSTSPRTSRAVEILDIDNDAVREQQVARLRQIRASRDEAKCVAALEALGEAARNGTGNLLALAIEATRARATVGEISDALEGVYGRHQADDPLDLRRLWPRDARATSGFDRIQHRRRGLRRGRGPPAAPAGREDGPGRPRPRRQGDRHRLRRYRLRRRYRPAVPDAGGGGARRRSRTTCMSIGVSSQAAGHKTLVPQLIEALAQAGRPRHPGRLRRRHPAAGLRLPEEGRRRRDLRPRHQHPGGGRRDPAPHRKAQTARRLTTKYLWLNCRSCGRFRRISLAR